MVGRRLRVFARGAHQARARLSDDPVGNFKSLICLYPGWFSDPSPKPNWSVFFEAEFELFKESIIDTVLTLFDGCGESRNLGVLIVRFGPVLKHRTEG